MELLFCIVNDTEMVDDIVAGLVEIGITEATVIESQKMTSYMSEQIPIFSGFKDLSTGSRPLNHTIISAVEPELVEEAVTVIGDIAELSSAGETCYFFTVPIGTFRTFHGEG